MILCLSTISTLSNSSVFLLWQVFLTIYQTENSKDKEDTLACHLGKLDLSPSLKRFLLCKSLSILATFPFFYHHFLNLCLLRGFGQEHIPPSPNPTLPSANSEQNLLFFSFCPCHTIAKLSLKSTSVFIPRIKMKDLRRDTASCVFPFLPPLLSNILPFFPSLHTPS